MHRAHRAEAGISSGARVKFTRRSGGDGGHAAVFTADGPRGPLYVAKRGPVLLAQKTGHKICCFHVAVERAWTLKSWDRMMIPKPFSRASFYITSPIAVPAETTDEELEGWRQRVQAALDRARIGAESKF